MNRSERRLLKFRPGLAADRAVSIPVHRQSLVRAMATKMRLRGLEYDGQLAPTYRDISDLTAAIEDTEARREAEG